LVSKYTAGSWLSNTVQSERIAFDGDRRQHRTEGTGDSGNSFESIGTIIVAHFKEKK
jgi:hypothetical protein